MGNRLTKIYTRTGDDGTTGLSDGGRIDKDDPRIEAIGEIDELNSTIGLLLSKDVPETIRSTLTGIQHRLFDIGGELSMPGHNTLQPDRVKALEQALDEFNSELPALKEFILPGGTPAAASCHLARAVCRRAERCVHRLAKTAAVNPTTLKYLNRLSDLLFVMARQLNRQAGYPDVFWQHER